MAGIVALLATVGSCTPAHGGGSPGSSAPSTSAGGSHPQSTDASTSPPASTSPTASPRADVGSWMALPPVAPRRVVRATAETEPVPSSGDAADDPAIWVDPEHPGRSVIIGTDKVTGLGVWDLTGHLLQFIGRGTPNNVDLRDGFRLDGELVSLVVVADDSDFTVRVYRVDPETRRLVDVTAGTIEPSVQAHGICLYRREWDGRTYAFVDDKDGFVEQLELVATADGRVGARSVRGPWDVGGETEGCVADDRLQRLFVAEEERGIWSYGAEPGDSLQRRLVDPTDGEHLTADVEGLAIAEGPEGTGYLIASSQGDNTFAVYDRRSTSYLGSFEMETAELDRCTDTDGIEVTTRPLGPAFPRGVFVCQDVFNPGANQNFKLVPLDRILRPRA